MGLFLRSSIAVGYMLDTNPANDLFSIMICEGPSSINAIDGIEDYSQHHEIHHTDHENTDNEHAHASQDHPRLKL
jgi:hypothetical protein